MEEYKQPKSLRVEFTAFNLVAATLSDEKLGCVMRTLIRWYKTAETMSDEEQQALQKDRAVMLAYAVLLENIKPEWE